jgi:bifunctional DNA-binding transcriptional regulator/antitoxin component of YhaV-PrlF toxin-antitoxin module
MIVPKPIRDALRWHAGTELIVEPGEDYFVVRRDRQLRPTTIDEVAGCLKYDGPPVSVEDMERAVEEELEERWQRKSR